MEPPRKAGELVIEFPDAVVQAGVVLPVPEAHAAAVLLVRRVRGDAIQPRRAAPARDTLWGSVVKLVVHAVIIGAVEHAPDAKVWPMPLKMLVQ